MPNTSLVQTGGIQLLAPDYGESQQENIPSGAPSPVTLDFSMQHSDPVERAPVTIALVDEHRFSQGCILETLRSDQFGFKILPFDSAEQLSADPPDVEVIVVHAHLDTTFDARTTSGLALLRDVYPWKPIMILSDARDTGVIDTYRSALDLGVNGLVPTRTTNIVLTVAAIHFVKAGGTFISKDMLLDDKAERPAPMIQQQFTSRQVAVLGHMARGRANKVIAHELNMSESTVKVHIRHIMRKVGATNRTEAVYKCKGILVDLGLLDRNSNGGERG